jgi:hypothetical protein
MIKFYNHNNAKSLKSVCWIIWKLIERQWNCVLWSTNETIQIPRLLFRGTDKTKVFCSSSLVRSDSKSDSKSPLIRGANHENSSINTKEIEDFDPDLWISCDTLLTSSPEVDSGRGQHCRRRQARRRKERFGPPTLVLLRYFFSKERNEFDRYRSSTSSK